MDNYVKQMRARIGDAELKIPGSRIVILNDEAQVLLQHQTTTNTWVLPSGSVQNDETAVEAVVRQTLQETGLEIQEIECIGYSSSAPCEHVVDENGHKTHCHALLFVSTFWKGELQPANKSTAPKFFSMNELPDLQPNMEHTLVLFKAWIKSRIFQIG